MIRLTKILKEVLKPDEVEMVNGIVDMLKQVKDITNRKQMALDRLKDFQKNNIKVDGKEFLNRCGLSEGICEREPGESDEDFYTRCGNAAFDKQDRLNMAIGNTTWNRNVMRESDNTNPPSKLRPEPHPTRHETEHPSDEEDEFPHVKAVNQWKQKNR